METERDKAFDRWFRLAELQLDFLDRWGTYKLNVARADLLRAAAAGQYAVARIKHRVARELADALRRLRRNRRMYLQRARRWAQQSRQLALVRLGEEVTVRQWGRLWAAFRVFENRVSWEVIETIMKAPVQAASRRVSQYVRIASSGRAVEPVPAAVENVYQLIAWLKEQRQMPRRGTIAYQQVVWAFGRLTGFAVEEISRLERLLKAVEQETLDAWQPVTLAALPDSVDVKKIIQAGLR
jgi:hypothetical protein